MIYSDQQGWYNKYIALPLCVPSGDPVGIYLQKIQKFEQGNLKGVKGLDPHSRNVSSAPIGTYHLFLVIHT